MDQEGIAMKETTKASRRRQADWKFVNRYFVGDGIDIGSGDDPLVASSWFLRIRSVREFDVEDGDANFIDKVYPENSFDFVHASNILEHMTDPADALRRWIRICRTGGHLVITVPDEDLYEQGQFPSTWNEGHLYTFTIFKEVTWSPLSINVLNLLTSLDDIMIKRVALIDDGYDYALDRTDQTFPEDGAEAFIEIVIQKVCSGG